MTKTDLIQEVLVLLGREFTSVSMEHNFFIILRLVEILGLTFLVKSST